MITCKINVTRIDKQYLFEGKTGKYLDIALMTNKDGPDQYGNDGFIIQDIPKEKRDAGEKGPIIGNWKDRSKTKPEVSKPVARPPVATDANGTPTEPDDVPF